jgi:hypothetical protein
VLGKLRELEAAQLSALQRDEATLAAVVARASSIQVRSFVCFVGWLFHRSHSLSFSLILSSSRSHTSLCTRDWMVRSFVRSFVRRKAAMLTARDRVASMPPADVTTMPKSTASLLSSSASTSTSTSSPHSAAVGGGGSGNNPTLSYSASVIVDDFQQSPSYEKISVFAIAL